MMAFYFDDEEAGIHAYFPDGEEDAGAEWVRDYLASVTPSDAEDALDDEDDEQDDDGGYDLAPDVPASIRPCWLDGVQGYIRPGSGNPRTRLAVWVSAVDKREERINIMAESTGGRLSYKEPIKPIAESATPPAADDPDTALIKSLLPFHKNADNIRKIIALTRELYAQNPVSVPAADVAHTSWRAEVVEGAIAEDALEADLEAAAEAEMMEIVHQAYAEIEPDYGVDIAGNRLMPLLDNGLNLTIAEKWSDWARYKVEKSRMVEKRRRRNALDLGLIKHGSSVVYDLAPDIVLVNGVFCQVVGVKVVV